MIKKAFSLIEILFALAIISIILAVAIPKLNNILNNTDTKKIKSDILIIKEALNNYKNKMILKGETSHLESLEDNNQELFNNILQTPIQASNKQNIGSWGKITSNSYKVYLEDGNSVTFIYNSDDYSFQCDENNPLCKELTQ